VGRIGGNAFEWGREGGKGSDEKGEWVERDQRVVLIGRMGGIDPKVHR